MAELLRAFWALLSGFRWPIAMSLLAATIASVLRLVPPAATGFALDTVGGQRRTPDALARFGLTVPPQRLLTTITLALIALALLNALISAAGRQLDARVSHGLQARLRSRVFDHIIGLPIHRIRAHRAGGLAGLLRDDVAAAASLFSTMAYNPWRSLVQLVGTGLALIVVDWRMLVLAVAAFPLLYALHRRWIRRLRPLWRDVGLLRRHSDAHATEAFIGVRVIRSFGRRRTETRRYARDQHLLLRQDLLAGQLNLVVEIGWSLVVPVAVAVVVWYAGTRILVDADRVALGLLPAGDAFTTGQLVTLLFYLAMLLEPLAVLASTAGHSQSGLAAFERVLNLLEEEPELAKATGTLVLRPAEVAGRVTLRRVSFQYPGRRRPTLHDITLDVPAGRVVALVGPSGAGKSTLCDVIARFHDPSEGVVELDGIDIRKIQLGSYRHLFGVVEQDVFLFEGTIAENIAYGSRDATPAAIVRAATAALASEFIESLDDGYETLIGERGVRLSGGQRKRLAIARALLADPRLLILDEATSELDAASERLIHRGLATLMHERTVFVIAHRLSTVAHADLIVLLERGRVVDQGKHAELLARSAGYQALVEAQLLDLGRPGGPASPSGGRS